MKTLKRFTMMIFLGIVCLFQRVDMVEKGRKEHVCAC
jgi:hypothetical protein